MKTTTYDCDLCGSNKELTGLERPQNCEVRERPVEDADFHLCRQCQIDLWEFLNKKRHAEQRSRDRGFAADPLEP